MTFSRPGGSWLIVATTLLLSACAGKQIIKPKAEERCANPSANSGNVGNVINSNTDDFAPQLIGNTLIFSSGISIPGKYPKQLRSELVSAQHDGTFDDPSAVNQGWQPVQLYGAEPLQGVPLDLNEGAIAILPQQHYAVFAAERIQPPVGQSSLMDLYEVQLDDNLRVSSKPQPIAAVNDPNAWESQPTLTPDGNTLFFVSDRIISPDSVRGHTHIYRSDKVGGVWSAPVILPAPYTTSGDDVTPCVAPDGFFYYASDGHPGGAKGLGGRDIYRVKLVGNQLSGPPTLLGAPFNSSADDDFPFVSADRRYLWLSSDREGGCGKRDIYAFPLPVAVTLRGTVTQTVESDSGIITRSGLRSTLVLHDVTNARDSSFSTDASGHYAARLRTDDRYVVSLPNQMCNDSLLTREVTATRPFGLDTEYVRDFTVVRRTLRDTLGRGSDVPFFITGYWRPNTSTNFREYFHRKETDRAFAAIHYIRDSDRVYDSAKYEAASHVVDRIFEKQIYHPILDSILPLLTKTCLDSNSVLHIHVNGYTDSSHVTVHDPYLDEDVHPQEGEAVMRGEPLLLNDGAIGEWGNKRLSTIRAYFTMLDIKSHFLQYPEFRTLYDAHRIVFDFTGKGIDYSARQDLGFNRRVDVVAWIGK